MIVYNGPVGEPVENPTDEFIKDIFFTKTEEYWENGSGDSCIEVEGYNERIIFFYDEPYGFFIMRHPDYLVLFDESVDIKTVVHKVGGEPMQIPTCSYISREKAYKIVSSFIKLNRIPDFVSWIDLYDIDFEYEF